MLNKSRKRLSAAFGRKNQNLKRLALDDSVMDTEYFRTTTDEEADIIVQIMEAKNFFEVLEVDPETDLDENEHLLRESYMHKCALLDPNKCNHPKVTEAFAKLAKAYDTLSDPKERLEHKYEHFGGRPGPDLSSFAPFLNLFGFPGAEGGDDGFFSLPAGSTVTFGNGSSGRQMVVRRQGTSPFGGLMQAMMESMEEDEGERRAAVERRRAALERRRAERREQQERRLQEMRTRRRRPQRGENMTSGGFLASVLHAIAEQEQQEAAQRRAQREREERRREARRAEMERRRAAARNEEEDPFMSFDQLVEAMFQGMGSSMRTQRPRRTQLTTGGRFDEALRRMEAMGFSDNARNAQALQATGGNVDAAINLLLDNDSSS